MEAEAIIPYAPLDDWHEKLLRHVTEHIAGLGIPIRFGHPDQPNNGERRYFNHPEAINTAVEQSHADVLLICDADTVPISFGGHYGILKTIECVHEGTYAWAMPRRYWKLTEESTRRALDDELPGPLDHTWEGDGISWAGVQIVRRTDFLAVRGWDERFIGWGSDDACFGLAMDALIGRHHRYDGIAMHLWHPQGPKDTYMHPNWGEQQRITSEYLAAAENPEAMAEIVNGRRQLAAS